MFHKFNFLFLHFLLIFSRFLIKLNHESPVKSLISFATSFAPFSEVSIYLQYLIMDITTVIPRRYLPSSPQYCYICSFSIYSQNIFAKFNIYIFHDIFFINFEWLAEVTKCWPATVKLLKWPWVNICVLMSLFASLASFALVCAKGQ